MSSDSENFEQLRRLLALKRHEQPPPGYFNGFSLQVLARLRAGEPGERSSVTGGFFERLWSLLEARPVFAGAFGAAFCLLLIAGILNSGEAGLTPGVPGVPVAAETTYAPPGAIPVADSYPGQLNSVTNPISDLFRQFPLQVKPVNFEFALPGGN